VKGEIKARKGFAVGHQRQDGRYRVIAYDLDGQSLTPRMPNGQTAPCLVCPCPKEAGRREIEAKRVDLRGIRRIVVTCYPEEVSAPVRNDQEKASCFIHGDFEGFDCPQCSVRNDRRGQK